jgi:hypothetical protein
MYNAIIDQVFLDQSCSMLSIFEYRFCMTDSSPVMADIKRGASVHLVRMHKLKKSTVNLSCGKSCSGSISIGNRVHLMFLRACYFGFWCSIKSLQWKLIIFTHILQLFCFCFCFIPFSVHQQQKLSSSVSNGTGQCNFSGQRDGSSFIVLGQRDNRTSSKSCHRTRRDFLQAVPSCPRTSGENPKIYFQTYEFE